MEYMQKNAYPISLRRVCTEFLVCCICHSRDFLPGFCASVQNRLIFILGKGAVHYKLCYEDSYMAI